MKGVLPAVAIWGSVFLVALVASLLGVYLIRLLAADRGWVAQPRADRWHRTPTALHGGVGFFGPFIILAAAISLWWYLGPPSSVNPMVRAEIPLAAALLAGSMVVFLLGLLDDVKQFSPAAKLGVQFIAALLFIAAGGVFPITSFWVVNAGITLLWIVGLTNAFNLLDNMDGLCAGVAAIAGCGIALLTFAPFAASGTTPLFAPLAVVLVGVVLGFWSHNRNPAKIFMGDSGSLFIGYLLACLSVPSALNGFLGIQGPQFLQRALLLLVPVSLLLVPILDTSLVTVTRWRRGRRMTQGGKDHLSHRLVLLGLTEKDAVRFLYGISAVAGLVAFALQQRPAISLFFLGLLVVFALIVASYLASIPVIDPDGSRLPANSAARGISILFRGKLGKIAVDLLLITLSYHGALLLRYDGEIPEAATGRILISASIVIGCALLASFALGIHDRSWRGFSLPDAPSMVLTAAAAAALAFLFMAAIPAPARLPGSILINFAVLFLGALCASRSTFRLFDMLSRSRAMRADRRPVLIYGAGAAGSVLCKEIQCSSRWSGFAAVGFIDDDPNLAGKALCGLPVKVRASWLAGRWERKPEVWISSDRIPEAPAREFAQSFEGDIVLRRFSLTLSELAPLVEAGAGRRTITGRVIERVAAFPPCPPAILSGSAHHAKN